VPRRTRMQAPIRRKRTPPTTTRRAPEAVPDGQPAQDDAIEPAAGYVRRRPLPESSQGRAGVEAGRAPVRQARALLTDYGFIVSELEKVGYTFAVLIILLIVVARLLR
jgi:hypothetical protein